MKRLHRGVLLLVASALCAVGASAQTYPNRPIRLIVADSRRRGARPARPPALRRSFRTASASRSSSTTAPGAGGVLGAEMAAKSAPDGYTLLLTTTAIYAILPNLRKDLPYDPVKDFVPISRIATASNVLVVNNDAAGEEHRGARQARQGEARRAQLRVGRRGHAGASGRRDAEPAGRHQGRARSVQGRGAGADRRHRGQRAVHHHVADRRWRAHDTAAAYARWRRPAPSAIRACPTCRRSPRRCPGTRSRRRGASWCRPARRRKSRAG